MRIIRRIRLEEQQQNVSVSRKIERKENQRASIYIEIVHVLQTLGVTGITVVDSNMHTRSNGSVR